MIIMTMSENNQMCNTSFFDRLGHLKIVLLKAALVSGLSLSSVPAIADSSEQRLAIYLWGAGLKGDIGNAAGASPVDVKFDDILDNLEAGFMLNYRGKWDQWSFGADYIYLNINPSSDTPPATIDLKQSVLELTGGYAIQPGIELLAGIRAVDISTDITVTPPPMVPATPAVNAQDDWVDPLIGIDYRSPLADKWHFYGRADLGGFGVGSDLTYQLAAYFGYKPSDNWNLYAGYRHLDFDYKSDNDKKFFYDLSISGPLAGFSYHF